MTAFEGVLRGIEGQVFQVNTSLSASNQLELEDLAPIRFVEDGIQRTA